MWDKIYNLISSLVEIYFYFRKDESYDDKNENNVLMKDKNRLF
jgi:hypothetical protein